jgi:hypothetical protein
MQQSALAQCNPRVIQMAIRNGDAKQETTGTKVEGGEKGSGNKHVSQHWGHQVFSKKCVLWGSGMKARWWLDMIDTVSEKRPFQMIYYLVSQIFAHVCLVIDQNRCRIELLGICGTPSSHSEPLIPTFWSYQKKAPPIQQSYVILKLWWRAS